MPVTERSALRATGRLQILSPTLCNLSEHRADAFVDGLLAKTLSCADVLTSDSALGLAEPDDVIVALLPEEPAGVWRASVRRYLERSDQAGVHVIPVSLDSRRIAPEPLSERAVFRVSETMRAYHLMGHQYYTAGAIFARVALSHLWPTYAKEDLQLFLSYRGSDGESLAAELRDAIHQLQQSTSFDLADLRAGGAVPAGIVNNLRESDALVLCDTPDAATSFDWLKTEMCVAMALGLPIVWLRVGQQGERSRLPIRPADNPDFDVAWPQDADKFHSLAIELIEAAFVGARNGVRRIESCLAGGERLNIAVLDGRRRILMLSRPRRLGPFELTDRVLVQAFGRRPTQEDGRQFRRYLTESNFVSADGRLSSIDAAAMLSPVAVWNSVEPNVDGEPARPPVYYASGRSLIAALGREGTNREAEATGPELLLFAALAEGQGTRTEFLDAVQDLVTYWLGRSGRIRFGGHPTVTPAIDSVARVEVPGRERDHVTIYQSAHFETLEPLASMTREFTFVETANLGEGEALRAASLTLMREEMVAGSNARAAVVIGGRTRKDSGREPGVAEETAIARRYGIPVFVLGATGGQAAMICNEARHENPAFSSFGNPLTVAENDELATTDDYTRAAELIWRSVAEIP